MKKIIKIFASFLLIGFLFLAWGAMFISPDEARDFVRYSVGINRPCKKPLLFSVGRVDRQFGLSEERIISIAKEAAGFWNEGAGKEILRFEASAPFKVNLVYDQRQASTNEAVRMESELNELDLSYQEIAEQYEKLNDRYKKKLDAYEKAIKEYKENMDEYNEEVEKWNSRGGAPPDVYEKLKDEKEELEDDFEKLEKMRKEVNALVKETNAMASQENQIAQNFNSSLETYTLKFGGSREFEKGVFDQESINIFQFQEEADLKLTFIHELGHYMGFDHVDNSRSIMYYLIGDQNLENPALTGEDLAEIERICRFKD